MSFWSLVKYTVLNNHGWIGAAIAAGASIFGSLMNANAVADTNEANVDLWREQAEYNKPINQVKRWREAGLNPNLMYGQGSSGNIQNLPKQEAPSYDFDFMRQVMMAEQVKNLDAQNKNLQAVNAKVKADTVAQKLQNVITANRIDVAKRNGLPYDLPVTLTTLADMLTGRSAFLSPEFQQDIPGVNLIQSLGRWFGEIQGAPLREKYKNYKTPYKRPKEQGQYFQSRY